MTVTNLAADVRRSAGRTFRLLGGGFGTAWLALGALLWLVFAGLTSVVGVGLLLLPGALRAVHAAADRERLRLSRWGDEVHTSGPVPAGLRAALASPAVRRELRWLVRHATIGWLLGFVGVLLPVYALRDGTFFLWWDLLPAGEATSSLGFWAIEDLPGAFGIALLGVCWAAIFLGLGPGMARLQAAPGRRLLAPVPGTDLVMRVAELTATRAAALDAHATELRRIERSLHDGTQNRLVATTVLLGAARRALHRDPDTADAILERAQSATEQALAELRAVARGILPPILADRGLVGALSGLAAGCPVPCRTSIDLTDRCAASVEATAYFVVAEALTNIAKHSRATRAEVTVTDRGGRLLLRVFDDGVGGADDRAGSGLAGIRGRIEAHDGTLALSSPPGGPTTLEMELPCGS